jgi:hypothetical protein
LKIEAESGLHAPVGLGQRDESPVDLLGGKSLFHEEVFFAQNGVIIF